jgi:lysophospholipase L1-like esterase
VNANFSYEANVTGLVDGNGSYNLAGFATGERDGADPWDAGSKPPLLEGASLVVIYQERSLPYSEIQIAEGASETDSGNAASATLDGFTVSAAPSVKTTYIVGDGQEAGNTASVNDVTLPGVSFPGADPQAVPNYSQGNLWDTVTTDVSSEVGPGDTSADLSVTGNSDCLVWVGQVLDVSSGPVLGLGDSVAAGYGLGNSEGYPDNPSAYPAVLANKLAVPVKDYAVEGACTTTGVYNCPATPVSAQIAQAEADADQATPRFAPSLVTIDVGADDIDFSECIEFIAEHQDYAMTNAEDRCSPGNLQPALTTFETNLKADLGTISTDFPDARILLMNYYNPFPPPPAANGSACAVGQGLVFEGEYKANKNSLLAVVKNYFQDPAKFGQMAISDQTQLYNDAQNVLTQLNGAIDAAAAAFSAVTVITTDDFAGHGLCSANPEWVFSPRLSVALTLGNPATAGFRLAAFRIGGGQEACPAPPPPGKEKPTIINVLDVGVASLDLLIQPNCSPHPTEVGQQALANDFYQQGG